MLIVADGQLPLDQARRDHPARADADPARDRDPDRDARHARHVQGDPQAQLRDPGAVGRPGPGSGRLAIWDRACPSGRATPFFGQGFGTRVVSTDWGQVGRSTRRGSDPRRPVAQHPAEMGAVGALALLWLFARAIRRLPRRQLGPGPDGWLAHRPRGVAGRRSRSACSPSTPLPRSSRSPSSRSSCSASWPWPPATRSRRLDFRDADRGGISQGARAGGPPGPARPRGDARSRRRGGGAGGDPGRAAARSSRRGREPRWPPATCGRRGRAGGRRRAGRRRSPPRGGPGSTRAPCRARVRRSTGSSRSVPATRSRTTCWWPPSRT